MDELNSAERSRPGTIVTALRSGVGAGILMTLFLLLLTLFAVYRQTPPAAVAEDAPAMAFSSGRALKHLEVISRRPHPIGSLEHDGVQDYILRTLATDRLGPAVQQATVTSTRWGDLRAATVRNIAGRLKGTGGSSKAILLAAHYDTTPTAPGASDDGASVAALLETMRALKASPPLKNDVICLFTDGEEIGLLGAQAFIDEHPWAKDVGLVLNFEARGASGSSVMFETSNDNGWLIEELAKAAPRPMANSLSNAIYRLLPNNTDLTIFRGANLAGMNFAYIDSPLRYHTQADNIENLDQRSLQHQGAYALSLARQFGGATFDQPRKGNAVYFDILGLNLVHYPAAWVLPLAVLAVILFVVVLVLGFRRKKLTFKGLAAGFILFVLNVIIAAVTGTVIWWLISTVQVSSGRSLLDDHYNSKLYLAGFVLIAVAVTAALHNLYSRKVSLESLTAGALFLWLVVLVLTSVVLPGGSYLLIWPLLFGLVALAWMLTTRPERHNSLTYFAVLSLCAIPGIVLVVPMIYQIFVALGLSMIGAIIVMVVLLCGLLVPHFALTRAAASWWLPGAAIIAAVILMALAIFNPGFDKQHPKSDSLFYVLNADTGKAVWASGDAARDEWTSQFFPPTAVRAPLKEYLPLNANNYLSAPAPVLPLQGGDVRVISDSTQGDLRTLLIRVTSSHGIVNLAVPREGNVEVVSAIVNGKRFENGKPNANGPAWELNYWSPPKDGFDLRLDLKGAQPMPLKIIEVSYGLPEMPAATFKARPDYIISSASQNSDQSLISKSYSF